MPHAEERAGHEKAMAPKGAIGCESRERPDELRRGALRAGSAAWKPCKARLHCSLFHVFHEGWQPPPLGYDKVKNCAPTHAEAKS